MGVENRNLELRCGLDHEYIFLARVFYWKGPSIKVKSKWFIHLL